MDAPPRKRVSRFDQPKEIDQSSHSVGRDSRENRRRSRSRSRSRSQSYSPPPRRRRDSRSPPRRYSPQRRYRSRSKSPSRDSRKRRSSRSRSPPPTHSKQTTRGRSRSRSPPGRNNDRFSGNSDRGGGRGKGRSGGPKHESTFRAGGNDGGGGKEEWGKSMLEQEKAAASKKPVIAEEDKEKPNFGLSGSLAAETNTVNGTLLKYNEPVEARKPTQKWRLYVFKGKEQVDLLHVHRQSAFLFGRDRNVVDIPTDHPSCSKQHAVLQYRQLVETDNLGQSKRQTKPFIIDLESSNGTFVNGVQIPATRYYELKLSDVLKFGASTREFVLLHDNADADL